MHNTPNEVTRYNIEQHWQTITDIISQLGTDWQQVSLADYDTSAYKFDADLQLAKRPSRHDNQVRYVIFSTHDSNCIGGGNFGKVYHQNLELKKIDDAWQHRIPPKVVKTVHKKHKTFPLKKWQPRITRESTIFKKVYAGKAHTILFDEQAIVVMQKLPGYNLQSLLSFEKLDYIEALTLAINIAKMLNELHAIGIVHADVKPANIMISNDRKSVKLTDFGAAGYIDEKFQDGSTGDTAYYPPEVNQQIDKQHRMTYSTAIDKYAFAGILVHLFGGENPLETKLQRDNNDQISLENLLKPYNRKAIFMGMRMTEDDKQNITRIINDLEQASTENSMSLDTVITQLQDSLQQYKARNKVVVPTQLTQTLTQNGNKPLDIIAPAEAYARVTVSPNGIFHHPSRAANRPPNRSVGYVNVDKFGTSTEQKENSKRRESSYPGT